MDKMVMGLEGDREKIISITTSLYKVLTFPITDTALMVANLHKSFSLLLQNSNNPIFSFNLGVVAASFPLRNKQSWEYLQPLVTLHVPLPQMELQYWNG
ncbi:hypothetical protein ES332_D12G162800v1 [Gossypium tomentosum]|uniref:Uncharacterized protein n=1 Tax=Gossypium tomentosum TaxID=34277 RepID=A0A5D2I9S5_GOSTO|nr:hypothetical protein ES332_D12G162800v1 [Gossypium tomentosum]